jgi:hypothetical protein
MIKHLSMGGHNIVNDSRLLRNDRFLEALVDEIASGSNLEAGWACEMIQLMFMRGLLPREAIVAARLAGPIEQLLKEESDVRVRCAALGVVLSSEHLARLVRGQVLESLKREDLRESRIAAEIVVSKLQEEVLARAYVNRLLESRRDAEIQEGLAMVSVMRDFSPYRQQINTLQHSTNPAIRYHNLQIRRRLEMEAEWLKRTNEGSGR